MRLEGLHDIVRSVGFETLVRRLGLVGHATYESLSWPSFLREINPGYGNEKPSEFAGGMGVKIRRIPK